LANPVSNSELIEALQWRYATKTFDPSKKIPEKDWQTLLHALRLSPSSYGVQPWKFLSIEDKALRERLKPHAWGQSQITDASHLIVFAYRTDITEADIDAFVNDMREKRPQMSEDSIKRYRDRIVGDLVKGLRHGIIQTWTSRQLYISLGVLLTSAALLRIDACPMEGFVPKEFDEILGLEKEGYSAAALCTLGYRSADDHYAKMPKVRYEADRVIEVW
jgi:nitroreductase